MPRTIESELALVTSGERWQDGAKINNSITGYPAALRALAEIEKSLSDSELFPRLTNDVGLIAVRSMVRRRIANFLDEINTEHGEGKT